MIFSITWGKAVGLGIIGILLRLLWAYYQWYASPLWKLPGSERISFWMGEMLQFNREPLLAPQIKWWKKAGKDVDFLHSSTLMGGHLFYALNADFIKRILTARAHRDPLFVKFGLLRGIIGNGLIMLEGEDWHRHRRIIHPCFQLSFIKEQLDAAVAPKVLKLISYWKQAGESQEINIAAHLSQITLDIIGEVGFSHKFNSMDAIAAWAAAKNKNNPKGDNDNKHRACKDEMMALTERLSKGMSLKTLLFIVLKIDFLDREKNDTVRRLNKAVDQVINNARAEAAGVAASKREEEENFNDSEEKKQDPYDRTLDESKYAAKSLLQLLFFARDSEPTSEKFSRTLQQDELRDEIKTFLAAGHETTATWCYWVVFALMKYPDVQQKVYEDICKHAPSNNNEMITLDAMEPMTYFEAFMKEVLRFYAPIPRMFRLNEKEETFRGWTIPPKTMIAIPVLMLHRSEKYWDKPEEFLPERWLGPEPPHSHPYAFLPFSLGPRHCIGYKFAEFEAKLMMCNLIRAFTFQLAPSVRDTDFQFKNGVALKMNSTVMITAKSRERTKQHTGAAEV